jgi:hypothetical protein
VSVLRSVYNSTACTTRTVLILLHRLRVTNTGKGLCLDHQDGIDAYLLPESWPSLATTTADEVASLAKLDRRDSLGAGLPETVEYKPCHLKASANCGGFLVQKWEQSPDVARVQYLRFFRRFAGMSVDYRPGRSPSASMVIGLRSMVCKLVQGFRSGDQVH